MYNMPSKLTVACLNEYIQNCCKYLNSSSSEFELLFHKIDQCLSNQEKSLNILEHKLKDIHLDISANY